jgi:hypothetical protein
MYNIFFIYWLTLQIMPPVKLIGDLKALHLAPPARFGPGRLVRLATLSVFLLKIQFVWRVFMSTQGA